MYHVLVVCTANQCRSPMAEGLIRLRLDGAGLADRVTVSSAGTWAEAGRPATAHAVTTVAERGGDISNHRSREVDAAAMQAADLVLVMTHGHREALAAEFPEARVKTLLMSALAGGAWDIDDPVGQPLDAYRATADELERLIDAGWERIAPQEAEHV